MRLFASLFVGASTCAQAATAAPAPPPPVVAMDGGETRSPLTSEAFRTAFGHPGTALVSRDGREFDFEPLGVVELGGGRLALVSTGTLRGAGHPESGLNAIHYLTRNSTGLHATGSWFGVGAQGSEGRAAFDWGVTRAISTWPVVYTEGGGVWQGCRSSWATLTELRPSGPVDIAEFPVSYSDVDTGLENARDDIGGLIASARRNRSFTISYSGTQRFRETYVRRGDTYRLSSGETRLPGC